MKLNLPFQGNYPITQTFGELYTDPTGHKGIDYALPAGTVVRSAGMGKIIQTAEEAHGYGRFILIDHGEGLQTIYA
ncbi:MAG TPA: peptidoglycan DD-metalloendopeptidase family protein, partial [Flexilinea sp.]|nr:peptidoglycan DD-metalloendopeptidase family protein [Flexilinea sp.]